jgi:RHS repeat-associated protein
VTTYSGANPPGYSASLASAAKGNQTSTTQYTDLSGSGTTITNTNNYDMFGNLVKAQVACCNEKNFTFTANTYWSKAEQVIKGNINGIYLTSSMSYNFTSSTMANQTDPNGQITAYGYDASQRLTNSTLPSTATTSTTYNAWGLATSSTESYVEGGVTKNITTSIVFNGFGEPIQEINEHGGQVNIGYDNMGRILSRSNPFPQGGTPAPTTTYQYDVLGRGTMITTPDNNTVTTTYSGKVTTVTDQVNRKTKREVDSLGRLIKVTEQDVSTGNLTQETNYTYDIADHLLQVNQGNQTRLFKYDAAGQLLYEKIPEQTATINDGTGTYWTAKYSYNDFNLVATKTDARGVVTSYTYDTLNRLTQVSYNVGSSGVPATPTVNYNYDSVQTSATKGLLLSVTVGSNYTESYSYSTGAGNGGNGGSRINLTATTYTIDSRSYTVNYQYNNANQRTQIAHLYPEYDSTGRLSALKNSAGVAWINSIAYNVSGQVTGDTLNTNGTVVNEAYGYDVNRLQLTSQTATKGATSLMNLTYGYSATAGQQGTGSTAGNSGQLMSISGTINATTESANYTYDLLGRVVTSNQTTNSTSAQRRFVYDRWGNRTSEYDATSGGNQIQSISLTQSGGVPTNRIASVTTGSTTQNYNYDANGNVTNDGVHTYQYDGVNRLVSVDNGSTAQYSYDQRNCRVKKSAIGIVIHALWDNFRLFAEYNGTTGTLLSQYVNQGKRLVAKLESGTTYFFLKDRISVRAVLNSSGSVVGRQTHLPFGEDLDTSGTIHKGRFTNYERDSDSGLDYAIYRQYSQNVGRFEQPDPYTPSGRLVFPQSWNRYAYTLNNPINFVDPLGLLLEEPEALREPFCEGPSVTLFGMILICAGSRPRYPQNTPAPPNVGSWALGSVSWTAPNPPRIHRLDSATLGVNISGSANLVNEANVKVTVKVTAVDFVDDVLSFDYLPPEAMLEGQSAKGRINIINFKVTFSGGNIPPGNGVKVRGRATLERPNLSTIDAPSFKESTNELILLPTDK